MSEFSYDGVSSNILGCGICMGYEDNYDRPIKVVEQNLMKILQYELIGLSESNINVITDFINKTKEMYLIVKGDFKDELTGFENEINIRLKIDTDIYNTYNYKIENGLLTIILFEKINDVPEFYEIG